MKYVFILFLFVLSCFVWVGLVFFIHVLFCLFFWNSEPSENEPLTEEIAEEKTEEKTEAKANEKSSLFSQMFKRIGQFFNISVS